MIVSQNNDHLTPLLKALHCLRVPERIAFRLAVLVYVVSMKLLRHTLLMNFTLWLTSNHDSGCVQRLLLIVPNTVHSTVRYYRSFPVAAAQVWNSLPRR